MSAQPCRKCGTLDCSHKRGGMSRAQTLDAEHQRRARAAVSSESCRLNGSKGAHATIKRYGMRQVAEWARQYRLANPSDLEQIVEGWFEQLGTTPFEREVYLFPRSRRHHITADFASGKRAVYVDGDCWHTPSFARSPKQLEREQDYQRLAERRGWTVLRLNETEIRDGTGIYRLAALIHETGG